MNPCTVVIIDDAEAVRSLLGVQLPRQGIEVLGMAADAAAGLSLVASQRPQAVLLDVDLPDRPGTDLLAELRAQDPALTVIMLTSHNDAATVMACWRSGADGYVVKTNGFISGLGERLRAALARRKQQGPTD